VRNGLDNATLVELFAWSESEFNAKLAGSAIRRIGYERWLRNLAVGMGNALSKLSDAPAARALANALRAHADRPSALVREHVAWALSKTNL
jgi:epoxyqueuosine reductase